ncbi:MAG TPA: hypothetical protein VHL53_01930 [Acidimicrobiia bacterium]|nr:hypothetical protein [Acidimicrobiia bacterium]
MILPEVVDALVQAEKDVVANVPRIDAALLEAEGVRYLARLFSAGTLTQIEAGDPAYPQLVPFVSTWITWGGTNPDSDYFFAAVDPAYTYRLRGRRGAVHLLAFETFAGRFDEMARISACDMRLDVAGGGPGNIAFEPDGTFEVVLSATEQPGNWLRIPEVPGHLLVRYCWYDWDVDDRPWVTIERDGAVYPPALPTVEGMEQRLGSFVNFLRQGPQMCGLAAEMYFNRPAGTVQFPAWSLHGDDHEQLSFQDQLYGQGHFAIGPDEAVIVEVALPESPYWSFNLSSPYLENTDWHLRQNSINGHQAVIDADGVFRAVISAADPGVPNWLDTGGQPTGIIQSRFLLPSAAPEVTLRTVPLAEVRAALPADTPIVTPAQRQEAVRRRVLAVQRRAQR